MFRRLLEALERTMTQIEFVQLPQRGYINSHTGVVEPDTGPVRNYSGVVVVVNQLPELRKTPSQRASRVIGDLPEQLAQVFSLEGAPNERQVGKQRAGFF